MINFKRISALNQRSNQRRFSVKNLRSKFFTVLKNLLQAFSIPKIRKKIIFVLFAFVIFRIMAGIPIPGVDIERMRRFAAEHEALGILNLLTGGALETVSIVMLGLGPFITAVILLQLLTIIFPKLKAMMTEEGEAGRQKFNQYGRILTVPFTIAQSFGMLMLLRGQGIIEMTSFMLLTSIITITAGTVLLMWIGELITENGIGNGISLLIFAGIIAMVPMQIFGVMGYFERGEIAIPHLLLIMGLFLLIIILVVLINEGRRNIPVSYAKRVKGTKMYGGVSTYIPLNINPAGVIPIIFAMSLMMFPGLIAGFLVDQPGIIGQIAIFISNLFAHIWFQVIALFLLITFFTYFYTMVTFPTDQTSENLQKMGGFIPGIRPGSNTKKYLDNILNRVLLVAGFFLSFLVVFPMVVGEVTGIVGFNFLLGGAGLLIVVSVLLETNRQINSQIQMREYDKY